MWPLIRNVAYQGVGSIAVHNAIGDDGGVGVAISGRVGVDGGVCVQLSALRGEG